MPVQKERTENRPIRRAQPHPPWTRRPLPYYFTDWAAI